MWCEVRTQDEEETIIVHNDGEDVGEQSAANQDTVQVDDDGLVPDAGVAKYHVLLCILDAV